MIPVRLTAGEKALVELLANGLTVKQAAVALGISPNTAESRYASARRKAGGVPGAPGLVHQSYMANALDRPEAVDDADAVHLTGDQKQTLDLMAEGLNASQIAQKTKRPLPVVRRDARDVTAAVGGTSPAHTIKRAWQLRLLGVAEPVAPAAP
ncbi:helix-turn-helix transcriptional regulator [Streptomyces sp. NPDC052042]|uniref:helix-turn-helix transcriptional regulator n=1 Tax=Streptomyces sp. NPDC052042 TaxID=3365683 RepID=UPI0037CDEF91